MNQQRVQTSQANKIKGKTTWRTRTNTRSKASKELEHPGKFGSTGHVLLHIVQGEKVGPNSTIGQPCQTGNHASPTKIKTSLLCLTSGPIAELQMISR